MRHNILFTALLILASAFCANAQDVESKYILNYHLMHPGGESAPADPNVAFCIDGKYHMHYILKTMQGEERVFSYIHVTSDDMLNWEWQKTKLQPSFSGHGMFSGTGFITKEGKPAAIYHGQGSDRNQIAIAKDNGLTEWDKPYPVEVKTKDGKEADMKHWDPDCFLVGDTYYAISGGQNPPVFKSKDLKNWVFVGDFLKHDMPDVAIGEDISCANFFKLDDKWVLLCISHPFGCRYYVGDWDKRNEQFVPEVHKRMNWRKEGDLRSSYRDFFAPESVETPDGRRVMWAWYAPWPWAKSELAQKSIQSMPRELSLAKDNSLRINPIKEMEKLRYDEQTFQAVKCSSYDLITKLDGDSYEIKATVSKKEAYRKKFGFNLFSKGGSTGMPITFCPETNSILVNTVEAPFNVNELDDGEDLEIRIFVDKYMVEVFVNGRQAIVAIFMDYQKHQGLYGYLFQKRERGVEGVFTGDVTFKDIKIWKLKPTNKGFFEAKKNRIWEIDEKSYE